MWIDVTRIAQYNVLSMQIVYFSQYLSHGVHNNSLAGPPPHLPPRHQHQEARRLPPRPPEDTSHRTDVQGLQTLSWIMESS